MPPLPKALPAIANCMHYFKHCMKHFYVFICLFWAAMACKGQNPIGLQQIVNFTSAEYKGGNQNWDIKQDRLGIMYFANNEGLLTYNGQSWKLYSIPSKTVVRSVYIAPDDRIYIGAQNDIGYFYPNAMGVLKYTSLKPVIAGHQNSFTDVWNIVPFGDKIFFRTSEKIFELYQGHIKTYTSAAGWQFIAQCNQRLFAQERNQKLVEYVNNNWRTVCPLPANLLITSILNYNSNTLLIATLKDGLFILQNNKLQKLNCPVNQQLCTAHINYACALSDGRYALASAFAGCFIIDHNGMLVQNFSGAQTLQKNNIRSVFSDRNKNIWLGLDDGISFIAFNSSIKQIYPDVNKQSSTYAVKLFNKALYIGTSDAVFKLPINKPSTDLSTVSGTFTAVPGTQGQVWNLNEVNNNLLLGNEDGAFAIGANGAKQIYSFPGTWLFKPLTAQTPTQQAIAGTYNGLHLLSYNGNTFTDSGVLPGLNESLRFLTIDAEQHLVWASHPYRGVYKIKLSANNQQIVQSVLYTDKDGLPSSLHNYVFKIKNRNVVCTENGIYEYNALKNRFYPSAYFYPMFNTTELQYLNEDHDGNIWFIGNKKVGVVDFSKHLNGQPFGIISFPELSAKVLAGFENVYPYNSNNIFIGSNRGVFHINYQKYRHNMQTPDVLIGQVRLIGDKDSLIFGGYFGYNHGLQSLQNKNTIIKLSHRDNSLHFDFSSTLFEQHSNMEFSYQLLGFDKSWSAWSTKSEKEYTNLSHGIYTFKVKARNNLGNESKVATYTLEIMPAWYETYWCYTLDACAAIGLLYSIIKIQQKKHQKAQQQLKYLHQLEIDHNEKEIITLKNEKLEAEVSFKNKELATTTMHLVQRGKLMSKIKEGVIMAQNAANTQTQDELVKVLKLINEAESNDDDWDHFAIHFDQVHSNFLSTLKNKFPNLSATDLKICAYLKMNLTSKEIAQLMSITTGAVEVSRYRLRKKLNLPSNINLFDYLIQITSTG